MPHIFSEIHSPHPPHTHIRPICRSGHPRNKLGTSSFSYVLESLFCLTFYILLPTPQFIPTAQPSPASHGSTWSPVASPSKMHVATRKIGEDMLLFCCISDDDMLLCFIWPCYFLPTPNCWSALSLSTDVVDPLPCCCSVNDLPVAKPKKKIGYVYFLLYVSDDAFFSLSPNLTPLFLLPAADPYPASPPLPWLFSIVHDPSMAFPPLSWLHPLATVL